MLFAPLLVAQALAASPDAAAALVRAARSQVGVTVLYDATYRRLAYPGGDVPPDRGVCTDVVIRAYRSLGLDLQVLVHDDMQGAPAAYPKRWRTAGTDRNIDHRRVPNLAAFFRRKGRVLPVTRDPASYRPADVVTWRLPGGLPHIGIVSDESAGGVPLVIHNICDGTKIENALFSFEITGHFRYLPGGS